MRLQVMIGHILWFMCFTNLIFSFTQVVGNFPETANLLLPRHTPLELKNRENLRREDEKNFQTSRQKRENETDRNNSQNVNAKVKAPSSAMSRS